MGSEERESKGYAWAVAAGLCAAFAAISAKFFSTHWELRKGVCLALLAVATLAAIS